MKKLLFCVVLVVALFGIGNCQCDSKNLTLTQAETGNLFNFAYVEYAVTVNNPCDAGQAQIWLQCKGFRSFTEVDAAAFAKFGDLCLLKNGTDIAPQSSFSFNYAWTQTWDLRPASSIIA